MGNLSPIELLLPGNPEQIRAEARRCLQIAREDSGGYLLAPSGAFIPGTLPRNIQAILDAREA
jgi:uroporphyrinogen-III decarboxylase